MKKFFENGEKVGANIEIQGLDRSLKNFQRSVAEKFQRQGAGLVLPRPRHMSHVMNLLVRDILKKGRNRGVELATRALDHAVVPLH